MVNCIMWMVWDIVPLVKFTWHQKVKKNVNFAQFMKNIVLCNDSSVKEVEGQVKTFGNPTEVALTVLGSKASYSKNKLLKKQ